MRNTLYITIKHGYKYLRFVSHETGIRVTQSRITIFKVLKVHKYSWGFFENHVFHNLFKKRRHCNRQGFKWLKLKKDFSRKYGTWHFRLVLPNFFFFRKLKKSFRYKRQICVNFFNYDSTKNENSSIFTN